MLRDLARALSLSTLSLIPVWTGLLDNPSNWPRRNTCWAVLINDLLLTAIFFAGITVARRSKSAAAMTVARSAFMVALVVPLNGIINSDYVAHAAGSLAAPFFAVSPAHRLMAEGALLLVGLLVFWRWHQNVISAAAGILLLLAPFGFFTVAQTVTYLTKFNDKPALPRLATDAAAPRRVVWLIFDELDYRLAFPERPASLKLDELDRLRRESFEAADAYPPANYSLMSIPAMITGRLIERIRVADPHELMIAYPDAQGPVPWSAQPNVFTAARAMGVNSAVVGWFIPYCRVIGDSFVDCAYEDIGKMTVWKTMVKQIRQEIETIPFSRKLGLARSARKTTSDRNERVANYTAMLEAARRAATDPSLGLVLLHWPVPHPPSIYNRATDTFELKGESTYIDNLLLVDHTVADIRRTMEAAGMWDGSTVIVTSDHWWRHELWRKEGGLTKEEMPFATTIDHRVPFILKLAGQRQAVTYAPSFNTVLSHDLLLAILAGNVRSTDDAVAWIDQHRSLGESPYTMGVTSGRREPEP